MVLKDVLAQLRPADREFLLMLAALAGPSVRVALVGGAVRDALLGQTPLDLDVVLEGTDVEAVAARTGLPFLFHPAFQNATITLPDGRNVDLVRSRRETYPVAGQNPLPEIGTLEDDLRRRDFSVNALALLLPSGELLDVVGGLADLQAGVLRPLHPLSFHDDASRLIRGARLAARLGLSAHADLLAQVPDALALVAQTPRLWAELKLMLSEPRPYVVAQKLREWGAGELLPELGTLAALDQLAQAGSEVGPQTYAAGLLSQATDADALAERLHLGLGPAALLERARSDTFYPAGTPERQLRAILRPDAYEPLTGKDVLAMGIPAGKGIGEALAHLAGLRRAGQVRSQAEEREALKRYLEGQL